MISKITMQVVFEKSEEISDVCLVAFAQWMDGKQFGIEETRDAFDHFHAGFEEGRKLENTLAKK